MAQDANSLTQAVEDLKVLTNSALSGGTAEKYETLEQHVNRLDSALREIEQAQLRGQVEQAIRALSSGQALSPEQQDAVRAIIVGDAESYLKMENNCKEWQAELKRLQGEMERLARSPNADAVQELRGVVKDAVRLLPNIRSHAEEKDRLNRFNAAFANLDEGNRGLLVTLLREKLSSTTR